MFGHVVDGCVHVHGISS